MNDEAGRELGKNAEQQPGEVADSEHVSRSEAGEASALPATPWWRYALRILMILGLLVFVLIGACGGVFLVAGGVANIAGPFALLGLVGVGALVLALKKFWR